MQSEEDVLCFQPDWGDMPHVAMATKAFAAENCAHRFQTQNRNLQIIVKDSPFARGQSEQLLSKISHGFRRPEDFSFSFF